MQGIRTDIFLNDRLHGSRRWPAVPRCGDLLWVGNAIQDGERKTAAWCVIELVRWIDNQGELSHVDIFVRLVPGQYESESSEES